jgi:hypothetical protein
MVQNAAVAGGGEVRQTFHEQVLKVLVPGGPADQ